MSWLSSSRVNDGHKRIGSGPNYTLIPMTDNQPVLALAGIHKRYGTTVVLNGLSLQVNPGEVYGFLGRNGAGKSTAIKIILGIIKQFDGEVNLFGQRSERRQIKARQRVGYVAQEQHFYPWMTPAYLGKFLSGFYPQWDKAYYQTLLMRFELPLKQRIAGFSGGMKAKLALSAALATRPSLLLLDEPTAGMDPVARREFITLVREQVESLGTTTFFSTHLMDEVEEVATRVGIIEKGKAVFEGDLAALGQQFCSWTHPTYTAEQGHTGPVVTPGNANQVLTRSVRQGQHSIITHRDIVAQPWLDAGWSPTDTSLEDAFIAMVASHSESHLAQTAR